MPIGPHRKSTTSMTRCQFFSDVCPLCRLCLPLLRSRSLRGSCREVWREGGLRSSSSMLVSDGMELRRREAEAEADMPTRGGRPRARQCAPAGSHRALLLNVV